jgi:hypothetical protein
MPSGRSECNIIAKVIAKCAFVETIQLPGAPDYPASKTSRHPKIFPGLQPDYANEVLYSATSFAQAFSASALL